MAYFIKINESIFKVPNRIIVGRGEPFTVLNDDRSVARSHLLLLQKGKKFYVKDLGTDSGSWIAGTQIKSKKLVEVKPDVSVQIGDSTLIVLSAQPVGDFIEIKGNYNRLQQPLINPDLVVNFIVFGTAAFGMTKEWKNKGSIAEFLFVSIFILIFCYFIAWAMKKWISLIKKVAPNHLMSDVYFSEEGFTVHYAGGGNMTFNKEKIKSWSINNNLVEISIYGENHVVLASKDQLRIFDQYLTKHLRVKKLDNKVRPVGVYAFGAVMSLMCLTLMFNVAHNLALLGALVLIPLMAVMIFNPDLRKYFLPPANKNFPQKNQTGCLVFITAAIIHLSFSIQDMKEITADIKKCETSDANACKEVDFYEAERKHITVKKETWGLACKHGNRAACQFHGNREIASEKVNK